MIRYLENCVQYSTLNVNNLQRVVITKNYSPVLSGGGAKGRRGAKGVTETGERADIVVRE